MRNMKRLIEQAELLKELLYLAPTDCLSCPRRDYWAGNREMPGELACYEDCEDRNNWEELLYVFNDVRAAEPKDKYSDEYDEWAELHDMLADDIGALRGTSEVFS